MSYRKEARKLNVPLSFIQDAVLEGTGAVIQHYEENSAAEIQTFKRLQKSEELLFKYFNIGCDNALSRNEEIYYTVNPVGATKPRSKKRRVRRHAGLVQIEQIAKGSDKVFSQRPKVITNQKELETITSQPFETDFPF